MELPDPVIAHLCEVLDRPDFSATRFRLIAPIGRGGMGTVYSAYDPELDRDVAVKVIDHPGASGEPRLLARLEHPGIVAVHDAGVLPDGRGFYVMRLVDGVRLDEFLAASPPLSERLDVMLKLLDAAGFAHSRGVVHRDLKPANVMVGTFGQVVVLDWGIALGGGPDGTVAGTSRYMAPEQARGLAVDARADIYALGVLMAELLPAPAPKPLAAIAKKAQSSDPAERYSSTAEFASDLRRYQDRLPVSAYAESAWERAVRFASRNRVLLLLLLTYVVVRAVLFFLRPQ